MLTFSYRRINSSADAPAKKRRVSRSKIEVMHDPEAAMQKLGMNHHGWYF